MKKKVLILANHFITIYAFRKELVKKLLEENYDVYLALPRSEENQYFTNMGCKIVDTSVDRRGKNPIKDLLLLFRYNKVIAEINPDIVLTFTIKPNIYGGIISRIKNVPYISNITGLSSAVEGKGLAQKFYVFLYKIAFKRIKCVFCQNQENMQFFIDNNIAVNQLNLIPGSGVNLEHFYQIEYPPKDKINFIFISRIMKQKGIDQYLEAAEFIKQKYPNTSFHILGFCEESYEEKLKELQERGTIKYHGMQKDIREFLKITHCTIHPTYYPEGLSNVLLESAASGRPLITTNRSGCREVVDNGVNGYIIEQQNSQDLKKKIEKFLELSYEDKKRMGEAARKKVEKEFNREIVVNAYMDNIKVLLKNKNME